MGLVQGLSEDEGVDEPKVATRSCQHKYMPYPVKSNLYKKEKEKEQD